MPLIDRPAGIAIIGGGFTGVCLALHLSRAAPGCRITVFEPRETLGQGLAYSTRDLAHRLNARAQRMSIYPEDPGHFCRWLDATGACADDHEAALPDGRVFARRVVYGRYVAAQLAPLLEAGDVVHVRAAAEDLMWRHGGWTVHADGRIFEAGIVLLATGHPPPGPPAVLAGIVGHPGFIGDPLRAGALDGVGRDDTVLIVGTGLTMADTVASLERAGHRGVIDGISRRGQSPRPHAHVDLHYALDFAPGGGAVGLVREIRALVARAAAEGLPWQSVFDALRGAAEPIWSGLSDAERSRLLRHVRPFWDTHRHRLPPPTAAIMRRRQAAGTLRIDAATVTGARAVGSRIEVSVRPRGGAAAARAYDAVVLTAGPGRISAAGDGLVARLLRNGLVALDPTGQGLQCGGDGAARPALFVAGPLARGTFAEIISVPEIARQVAGIARGIATEYFGAADMAK